MKRVLQWTLVTFAAALSAPLAAQDISFENIQFQADLSRVVGQLAQAACSPDARTAQAASGALAEIQQDYYQSLTDAMDGPDAEVRARVGEIFRESLFQASLSRTLRGLSPDARRKLESFAVDHRDLVELCLMGREQQRINAINKIRNTLDRQKSVEPLLRALIYSDSQNIATSAAAAVVDLEYKSDELATALSVALARSMSATPESPTRFGARRMITFSQGGGNVSPILDALVQMRSRQAAPVLAAALLNKSSSPYTAPVAGLCSALAATGEKGAIPALLDRLVIDRSDPINSMQVGAVQATSRRVDGLFYALAVIARQNPSDYKMIDLSSMGSNPYLPPAGFADDKARRAAFEKFRDWWSGAKQTPEYKDVQPIQLADLKEWAKGRTATAPASSEPASEPNDISLPPTQELRRQLSAVMRQHIENLGADRQSQRRNAQSAIINVLGGILSAILNAQDANDPQAVDDALAQATSEAKIAIFLGDLPKADRAKVIQYRKGHNALLASIFSDDLQASIKAVASLPKNDPDCLAEPVLLYCLRQPGQELLSAASEAIASGHYKSDATVEAMLEIIARTDPRTMLRSYGGENSAPAKILKAVKEIKPPAATPILLAHLMSRPYGPDWQTDGLLIDAIEAVGDKRAVPVLAERFRAGPRAKRVNNISFNNKKITWSESDSVLYLAVKMTGQKPEDYAFAKVNMNGYAVVGFADEKARTEAVKKFLTWWDENKNADVYKDLKPLVLPNLTPSNQYADPTLYLGDGEQPAFD